ncbi:inositol monophosphatase family protein [Paracoccus sp. (in: a-proteobacteria)]|uniref:inositol monophosphatase family protein n=1 Tax=Paracoccus sp. TaxID=267 RepID=UPI0028B20D45|nr:inositol monophosphatase family protein [Paracoccus sp. (in: a-proteobacteria)]
MKNLPTFLLQLRNFIQDQLPALEERRYDVCWKPDGSPVTAADVFLENAIRDWLARELIGMSFVGEESWTPGQKIEEGWVAVLDPIDGTENFCSGLKEWGTSLSLWRNGAHQGSMLLMPELGEWMTTGAIPRVPRSRIVGFSSSYTADIGQGLAQNAEGRIMGCAVYNLFNVIRGAFARFVNPKGAYSWDLLAGVALAREAGCEVKVDGKDYDGQFLQPGRRYCVDIRHRYDFYSG